MDRELQRTALIYGSEKVKNLAYKKVAVFGIGGVGGYVCEALARSGIGEIDLIDSDKVDITNVNRQIIALHSTIGRYKTEVMAERIKDINPDCQVGEYDIFFDESTVGEIDFSKYDYIADCIDSVKSKVLLIKKAKEMNVPVISAMGTGNKTDPTQFRIADIYKTSYCPLCKVMRRELKAAGVDRLNVVYSEELPVTNDEGILGSTAFCPSVAGLIMAKKITEDMING